MQVTICTITISQSRRNLQAGKAAARCSVEKEDSSPEPLPMSDRLSDGVKLGQIGRGSRYQVADVSQRSIAEWHGADDESGRLRRRPGAHVDLLHLDTRSCSRYRTPEYCSCHTSEDLERHGEKVEWVSRSNLAQELLPDGARGRNGGANRPNIFEQEWMTRVARSGGSVPGIVGAHRAHPCRDQTLGMRCRRAVARDVTQVAVWRRL